MAQLVAGGAAWAMLRGNGLGSPSEKRDHAPGDLLLASALSLLASFLLGTQAFVNYYAFAAALLLCAALLFARRDEAVR
jgi:hypothetical protein